MTTSDITSVSHGAAYARRDGEAWRIGTGRIEATIACATGQPARLTAIAIADGRRWDLAAEALFRLDTSPPIAEPVARASRAWVEGDAVHLAIELARDDGSTITVRIEAHEGQGIIRQWLEVAPAVGLAIDMVRPLRLAVSQDDVTMLHTVSGVQRQGGWRPDEGPYRSFRLEHEAVTSPVHRSSGLRSTWDETPWMALTGAGDGGLLLAFEYGGQWELSVAPETATQSAVAAFSPAGIVPRVAAGERWASPAVWLGAFAGDLDSAAAVMHRYLRQRVLPPTDERFPWVQYNTWFSWYCELDATTLLAEAEVAAALGVEVFYVDAGWWVGNPRRRDRFSSGLGTWTENREKFPDGLKAFADAIRAMGMHFGLWVEPERVDLRTATTGTWKPEWIAVERPGRYVRCDWPADTETAWLCFGNPETQAWATRWIGDLVDELGIRWLKWDSNYWGVCTSPDHGHGTGDGERAQLEGVYTVMAELNARFPDLVIENCAGGATRMDFALARQTPAAWLNDASEPSHRSRFHNAGASYLFPPEMLNAWITESEHENVNGQDLPDPVWRAVIRSRMLGAMGFSCRLMTWSEAVKDVAREEIGRYRDELRPLLTTGSFHHLLPQPVIPSRDLPTPDTWEAYQVTADDGDAHVVLGFRNVCPSNEQRVALAGIDPGASYTVAAEGAEPRQVPGAELAAGLTLGAPLLASTWVTIRREGTTA